MQAYGVNTLVALAYGCPEARVISSGHQSVVVEAVGSSTAAVTVAEEHSQLSTEQHCQKGKGKRY